MPHAMHSHPMPSFTCHLNEPIKTMPSPLPQKYSDHRARPSLELRVLQGAQAGASVELTGDGMTIGSATTCDVILAGAGIAPLHARLEAGADDFSVVAIDGSVAASAGAPCAAPWPLGTTIHMNGIAITVDHAAAPWNEIAPPPLTPLPAMAAGAPGGVPLAIRPVYKVVAAVLTFILICAVINTQWQRTAKNPLSSGDMAAIKHLLAQRSNSSSGAVLAIDTTTPVPVVRGYLPTTKQLHALSRELEQWRGDLQIAVLADDALASAGRQFLIAESSALKISVAGGRAQLSGLSPGKKTVQRLAADLRKKVVGLAAVDLQSVGKDQLEEWLQLWRERQPATVHGPVQIRIAADVDKTGRPILDGALAPEQIQKMMTALVQRSRQKKLLLDIASTVDIRPELSNPMPSIRAFSAGAVPYVFLTDGQRIMIGGMVNGFNLVAIDRAGPVFKRQGA